MDKSLRGIRSKMLVLFTFVIRKAAKLIELIIVGIGYEFMSPWFTNLVLLSVRRLWPIQPQKMLFPVTQRFFLVPKLS